MNDKRKEEVLELLSLAAAAGVAALFVRKEMGPTPFFKSSKMLTKVALVALPLSFFAAVIGANKPDSSTAGRWLQRAGIFGILISAAAFFAAARRKENMVLTSGGPDVFKAQLGLLQLGYPVPTTGVMDVSTKLAIQRFQTTYSLQTQDGTLTPETSAYIEQAVHSSHQQQPFTPDVGYHPQPTLQT